jgi:hypothetical protein
VVVEQASWCQSPVAPLHSSALSAMTPGE